jgi:hypothetical protein
MLDDRAPMNGVLSEALMMSLMQSVLVVEEGLSWFKTNALEPIIQVLDFMNKLLSSKFQVPDPGTGRGQP